MNLKPPNPPVYRKSEAVSPGSLIFDPDGQRWGIQLENGEAIWLGKWTTGKPFGSVVDFGKAYELTYEPGSFGEIRYAWDQAKAGSLSFYADGDQSKAAIVVGRERDELLRVIAIESGSVQSLDSNYSPLLVVRDWCLRLISGNADVPSYQVYTSESEGRAS